MNYANEQRVGRAAFHRFLSRMCCRFFFEERCGDEQLFWLVAVN